jgi:hypothetical protein
MRDGFARRYTQQRRAKRKKKKSGEKIEFGTISAAKKAEIQKVLDAEREKRFGVKKKEGD